MMAVLEASRMLCDEVRSWRRFWVSWFERDVVIDGCRLRSLCWLEADARLVRRVALRT